MSDTRLGAPEKRTGDNLYPARLQQTFGPHELDLDVPAGVWNPTPHGLFLGEVLLEQDFSGEHVLELGSGCGVHTILLARRNASALTVTEIDRPILDNTKHNLEKHGVDIPVDYLEADWTHVEAGPFDALVTNPPFAKSGKRYRRHFIDTLILDAHKLVKPGGRLVFIQSSMANVPKTLGLLADCGMSVRILGERDHPFRDYYFEDDRYLVEMASIPGAYAVRDRVHYERLVVFEAKLP